MSTVYNSLGAAYQGTKSDSCVYYFEKGLEISQKNKDYLNMMTTYQNLGDYYMDKKNNAKAVEYMKRAIAVNDLRPEDQYKPALYERIGILYESMGDFKNAYHYKKLENETRQRLFSVAKQKRLKNSKSSTKARKKKRQSNCTNMRRKKQRINKPLCYMVLLCCF
ncbi:tetratricopeptide repeat protein [Flavobacterium lindanitolerans]|nr:tetratricopeptide repeat protein [Flavobacterium lindanitolerans]